MDGYIARGYQLEMLDQSLKENIILVVCCIHSISVQTHPANQADGHWERENTRVC